MGLSRRNLKGISGGIAHKFNCSSSYYAYQAVVSGQAQVKIDLLTLKISPALFDAERNQILAGMCRDSLLESAKKWEQLRLQSAEMAVDFVLDSADEIQIQSNVFVTITDERGKCWHGQDCSDVLIDWRERDKT